MNVLRYVNENNLSVKVLNKALPDEFIEHGEASELKTLSGLGTDAILEDIFKWSK